MSTAPPYWIPGFWSGRLGISPRPRGGEWLEDELRAWKDGGTDEVVSLLTADEESELGLVQEGTLAGAHGLRFCSLPIPDLGVPQSSTSLRRILDEVDSDLAAGRNVVIHCRQGIGRSGLVAACLLIGKGMSSEEAMARVSAARGVPTPETPAQRAWIESFASSLLRG